MPFDPNTPANPNQPGNPQPPQQPGYGQPQYPQPESGYPQYPQPGYGQPSYPQGMGYNAPPPAGAYPPGYPGAYGPPPMPQPRKNRGWMIASIVGGVLLLCIVVCVGSLYAGGIFLRSTGSSIFNSVYATQTALSQQVTPTVPETVIYQDTMTDSPTGWASDSSCTPKSDGYHVSGGTICSGPDAASSDNVDVTVTVQGVKITSNTAYEVIVRHVSSGNFYAFEVTPDGQWGLFKFVNGNATPIVNFKSSAAIKTGASVTNDMRVLVVGSHFVLFVNDQELGVAEDSTFATGGIGLGNDDSASTSDVVFTNLIVAQPSA